MAPIEVAGYYSQLFDGLKSLGVRVDLVTKHDHPFRYAERSKVPRLVRISRKLRSSTGSNRRWPLMAITGLLSETLWITWTLWAVLRYDAFIFSFGSSLWPRNLDLPILQRLGKFTISNIGHGSEARPPYMDGFRAYQEAPEGSVLRSEVERMMLETRSVRTKIRWIEKYSSVVIGAPLSSSVFTSKPFVSIYALGVPSSATGVTCGSECADPISVEADQSRSLSQTVRIIHSPSNPDAKGTNEIKKAVKQLQDEGINLEFVCLEGVPNEVVLDHLRDCDFVVDQLYSDTPLAGFATEAARCGKVAVVGGYGWDVSRAVIPPHLRPVAVTCAPEFMVNSIRMLAMDATARRDLGRRARNFVLGVWRSEMVASRFLQLLKGDVPADWYIDPQEVCYVSGAGLSEEACRKRIKALVDYFGPSSLQVDDKYELLKSMLRFSENCDSSQRMVSGPGE